MHIHLLLQFITENNHLNIFIFWLLLSVPAYFFVHLFAEVGYQGVLVWIEICLVLFDYFPAFFPCFAHTLFFRLLKVLFIIHFLFINYLFVLFNIISGMQPWTLLCFLYINITIFLLGDHTNVSSHLICITVLIEMKHFISSE